MKQLRRAAAGARARGGARASSGAAGIPCRRRRRRAGARPCTTRFARPRRTRTSRRPPAFAASRPAEIRQAACQLVSRIASVSMYASAARWPTAWNIAIGWSNCLRVLVYSEVERRAPASQRRATRMHSAAQSRAARDHARILRAVRRRSPSTASAPTRTPSSVEQRRRAGRSWSPSASSVTPAAFGIDQEERLLRRRHRRHEHEVGEISAAGTQSFLPVSRHPSPSRAARSRAAPSSTSAAVSDRLRRRRRPAATPRAAPRVPNSAIGSAREHDRLEQRDRRRVAPATCSRIAADLEEAEAGAADALGHRDAEQARVGAARPRLAVEARLRRASRARAGCSWVARSSRICAARSADRLLIFGEGEVHGGSSCLPDYMRGTRGQAETEHGRSGRAGSRWCRRRR